jgi:hypothetical protein
MKRILFACLILLAVSSCAHKGTFRVDGTVQDSTFNGSEVYLVALDGPITKNVDSTILVNGSFSFEKEADPMSVRILRIRAHFPKIIEDLVVVLEPGSVVVKLSDNSYGSGTQLNNILQGWKEKKHAYDLTQASIFSQIRADGTNTAKTDSLRHYSDNLSLLFRADVMKMMNENLHNGIGLLLFKVYYQELSAEEKKSILTATGNLYSRYDAQLKLMIGNDHNLSK